jgi:hypothetical protein
VFAIPYDGRGNRGDAERIDNSHDEFTQMIYATDDTLPVRFGDYVFPITPGIWHDGVTISDDGGVLSAKLGGKPVAWIRKAIDPWDSDLLRIGPSVDELLAMKAKTWEIEL